MMQVEIKNNKIRVPLKGKDEWLVLKPEEQVRQEYICRLVNNYGFVNSPTITTFPASTTTPCTSIPSATTMRAIFAAPRS